MLLFMNKRYVHLKKISKQVGSLYYLVRMRRDRELVDLNVDVWATDGAIYHCGWFYIRTQKICTHTGFHLRGRSVGLA